MNRDYNSPPRMPPPSTPSGYDQYDQYDYQDDYQYYEQDAPMQNSSRDTFIEPPKADELVTLPRRADYKMPAYDVPERQFTQRTLDKPSQSLPRKEKPKSARCMFCCIPTNRKSRIICLSVTLLLLIIIGVIGYVFYPKTPDMKVMSITIPPGSGYRLTAYDATKEEITFSFEMDMVMNISVLNSNSFDLTVDGFDLTAYIKANQSLLNLAIRETGQTPAERIFARPNPKKEPFNEKTSKQVIGKGKYGKMTFRSGVNQTFIMNLTIAYAPSADRGALNDAALNEVIQLCVESDSRFGKRTTTIGYEAAVDLKPLSFVGLAPKLGSELKINCPFQGAAREQLLSALKGAASSGGSTSGTLPNSSPETRSLNRLLKSNLQMQSVVQRQTMGIIHPNMIEFV